MAFRSHHKATPEPGLGLWVLRFQATLKVTLFWQCVESQMLGAGEADFHLAVISAFTSRINIKYASL